MLTRDLVSIRGSFRYASRDALEDALWRVRVLLDAGLNPPRFRCWVTGGAAVSIDIVVQMFDERELATTLCAAFDATAIESGCTVRSIPRLACGTVPPDLGFSLNEDLDDGWVVEDVDDGTPEEESVVELRACDLIDEPSRLTRVLDDLSRSS